MPRSPNWLQDALSEYNPRDTVPNPVPIYVEPGDICLVRPVVGRKTGSSLVLVIDVDNESRVFEAALLTNEPRLLSAMDLLLDPETTGLRYPIGVLSLVTAHLWHVQIDQLVAHIHDEYVDAVLAMTAGREHPLVTQLRGLALKDEEADLRWRELEKEASRLRHLSEDCEARISRAPIRPNIDPTLLVSDSPTPSPEDLRALAQRDARFSPSVVAWALDNMHPVAVRAFAVYGLLSYEMAGPPVVPQPSRVRPNPPASSESQATLISLSLTDAAADRTGTLRLLTCHDSMYSSASSVHTVQDRQIELLVERVA